MIYDLLKDYLLTGYTKPVKHERESQRFGRQGALARRLQTALGSASCVLVICLAAMSCTNSAEPEPAFESGSEVTLGEATMRAEEAVRRCMAQAGFEYQMRPYIEAGFGPTSDWAAHMANFFLEDGEEWGYRGVFSGLAQALTPTGAPPVGLSRTEIENYNAALLGTGTLPAHETDNAPHSHGDDAPHAHGDTGEVVGCQAQGTAVFKAQTIEVTERPANVGEAYSRLLATDEFGQYSTEWSRCMSDAGFAVLQTDPTAHQRDAMFEFLRRTIALAEQGTVAVEALPALQGNVVDLAWFDSVRAEASELDQLYGEETKLAAIDAECRSDARSIIEPAIESIEGDLGLAGS